jgi:phospholipid/cholesterol/gamma-HCH transport system substrate-binding protein
MKRYGVHMTAIIVMVVVAIGVTSFLLSHQRFYLPAWVPVIGTDFYRVSADFSSAQAVTPGQGQTVNIAGVPVGEIGSVKLKNGAAHIELKIRRAHSPVYKDVQLALRPKTPLDDMYIDMKPGHKSAGEIPEGGNIPLANTKPTVNFDEFLAVLDSDTRDYFQSLLTNAGTGLKGQGGHLRSGFKRFPSTGKYGVQITKALELRRHNIKRAITNLALLAKELGDNSDQFASLIDSSSITFRTWASEQESIRQIIQKAPGAFGETADAAQAAQQVVADSAIAFKELQPLAEDLGVSQKALRPFFRDQTKVTRDSFRPLAVESQPLLAQLNPSAAGLAKMTPNATAAVASFNNLLNIVAYNPKGSEEGYLYWLSWFAHLNTNSFNRADANGVVQTGAILGTGCDYAATGAAAKGGNQMLALLTNLTNIPTGGICK